MSLESTVYIVDDDELARESICALVRSMGLTCQGYASAEDFLAAYKPEDPGCLITDLRMLGMSGLELQERLIEMGIHIPVIVITAYAKTPITVRAMKNGAVTLLEKPIDDQELWEAIQRAQAQDREQRLATRQQLAIHERFASLTPDEREVVKLVVAGDANKVIAIKRGVSIRTVENRRREIYRKMQAESLPELVRLMLELEQSAVPHT